MSIFPFFENTTSTDEELPLYKEIAWDFVNNKPIIENGDFKFVTGIEAVKSWIYRTIQTERYKHEIYSWNHASELNSLIGKPFNSLNKAEAERIVRDSIIVNPYITDLEVTDIQFIDSKITIELTVQTVYGSSREVLSV